MIIEYYVSHGGMPAFPLGLRTTPTLGFSHRLNFAQVLWIRLCAHALGSTRASG